VSPIVCLTTGVHAKDWETPGTNWEQNTQEHHQNSHINIHVNHREAKTGIYFITAHDPKVVSSNLTPATMGAYEANPEDAPRLVET
jgi:hypothetical protein